MVRFLFHAWTLAAAVAVAGCRPKEPEFGAEREVPAGQRPVVFGQSHKERLDVQDMASANSDDAPAWEAVAPAHWQSQPPDASRFRDLAWLIGGAANAECYLTASVRGSLADNVRRWCEQFGAAPLDAAAIEALPKFELLGEPAQLLELQGTFRGQADTKMLLLARSNGGELRSTFRFTGPAAVATAERDNFLAVAKSVRARTAATGHEHTTASSDHAASSAAPFAATIPVGWSAIGDTGTRLLRHRVQKQGECYIGQLSGNLSSMLSIWYGEVGQDAPDAAAIAALPKVPLLGADGVLLDLHGDFHGMGATPITGARLLVAVREDGGRVVFVKCVGPAAEVEAERAAFLAFCQSVRRTEG